MKRFSLIHYSWAFITIGAFVWGAFRSESPKTAKESGSQKSLSGSDSSVRFSPFSERSTSSPTVRSLRSRQKREAGEDDSRRLSGNEIDSLIGEAIKFGGPVQRRLALDGILQKIQASEITFEDALAIRAAMKKLGANEEWKLLGYSIGAHQSDEAIAHLEKLPSGERVGFLKEILPGLASENPEKAIGLFESLEPELQAKIRPGFLEGLVDNDAVVATDYLYDSTDPKNRNWRPMDELARELVNDQGLESTLDWAAELPEGSLRGNAWSAAYAVWASKDPTVAAKSINEMPPGVDRNSAINGFVSAYVHENGELAAEWVLEIDEPNLREAATIRVGKQFYAQDPEAANQWIASNGLSESVGVQVRNSVNGQ